MRRALQKPTVAGDEEVEEDEGKGKGKGKDAIDGYEGEVD